MADETGLSEPFPGVSVKIGGDIGVGRISQGIQTGMKLAALQQETEMQREKLKMQQEEHQRAGITGMATYLQKLADPNLDSRLRNSYADLVGKYGQAVGVPMHPDVIDTFKNLDPNMKYNLNLITSDILRDPDGFIKDPDRFGKLIEAAGSRESALQILQDPTIQQAFKNQQQEKLKQVEIEKARLLANSRIEAAKPRIDQAQQRLDLAKERLGQRDQGIHQKYVEGLTKDKQLNDRLTQYSNLDNALNLVTKTEHLTPEQIMEFQNSVRSNLGIKGTGGVEERQSTYINTLGLKAEKWKEFLTGNPADIAKDDNLVSHLKDVAINEQKNIYSQMQKRIAAKSAGAGTFYKKHPDLLQDFNNTVKATQSQFTSNVAPGSGGSDEMRKFAQDAISKGADPAAVKARFKQQTGQDF